MNTVNAEVLGVPGAGPASEPWSCPSCSLSLSTPYCSACGERKPHPHELTLRGFLGQCAQAITSIDGRLISSFRMLLSRPGALTVAYLQGQRKHYSAPLQLFFLANVLVFAMHSITASAIFSTPLDGHLHSQPWGGIAQQLVTNRLESTHRTLDRYAPVFDHAITQNGKSLIILMVLPFALLPPILFRRSGRPFVTHVVFSLHFYAFLSLLLCGALVIVGADKLAGGSGLKSPSQDHVLTIILLLSCAAYLFSATRTVYGAAGAMRILKVAALVVAVASTVLGYRFTLLLITLYST